MKQWRGLRDVQKAAGYCESRQCSAVRFVTFAINYLIQIMEDSEL